MPGERIRHLNRKDLAIATVNLALIGSLVGIYISDKLSKGQPILQLASEPQIAAAEQATLGLRNIKTLELSNVSMSTALDHANNTVELGLQRSVSDNQNSFTELKSFIAIKFKKILPTDPLKSGEILENPLKSIDLSYENMVQITIYTPEGLALTFDEVYIKQNRQTSEEMLDSFKETVNLLQEKQS